VVLWSPSETEPLPGFEFSNVVVKTISPLVKVEVKICCEDDGVTVDVSTEPPLVNVVVIGFCVEIGHPELVS